MIPFLFFSKIHCPVITFKVEKMHFIFILKKKECISLFLMDDTLWSYLFYFIQFFNLITIYGYFSHNEKFERKCLGALQKNCFSFSITSDLWAAPLFLASTFSGNLKAKSKAECGCDLECCREKWNGLCERKSMKMIKY